MRSNKPRRSRPRRSKGGGVSPPIRSKPQSELDRLAKHRGGGSGGESSQNSRWAEVGRRIDVSYDVLGHPYHRIKPVGEGKHYETLAYTDWCDTFVPTVVKWNHGAVDSFTDPAKSRENQRQALQYARSNGMSQSIKLPVGGGTLKVGSKEYVFRTGDRDYEAAQEKAEDLRKQGNKAVLRKEKVAGKPTYVVYIRKEGAQ
ncbi:MAG: hypothetical protein ABIJ47_08250 [Candidatus Bathyarchaeota archaeon]